MNNRHTHWTNHITNEMDTQWGTKACSNMRWWIEQGLQLVKNIIRENGQRWRTFKELIRLRRTRVAPPLYARMVNNIPWIATSRPPHTPCQWLARYEEEGHIKFVFHLHQMDSNEASLYMMEYIILLGKCGSGVREIQHKFCWFRVRVRNT